MADLLSLLCFQGLGHTLPPLLPSPPLPTPVEAPGIQPASLEASFLSGNFFFLLAGGKPKKENEEKEICEFWHRE